MIDDQDLVPAIEKVTVLTFPIGFVLRTWAVVVSSRLQLFRICVTSMSDLLLNWLNDQIQLSKRIANFEEDFHNGFLFGELLAKYSQQLNFHQFVDKDDKASRIKNFSLLLDTFSALKVTYDSNIAIKIINKQLGVAKKLLYELKTQLQKTNANAFSKTNRMNKTLSPLKKLQISKQKFDNVNKQHFVKQLNELHPAQKQIVQDRLLSKFEDFHANTLLKVAHAEEKQRQAKLLLRKKFNEQQRENLKKSEEFRKQWEAENVEKWAVNMSIRQTQVAKDQNYRSKIQFEKSQYKTMSEMSALKALDSDIAEFQRRNLGKAQDDSDEEPPKEEPKMLKEPSKVLERTDPQLRLRQQVREQRRMGAAETEKKRHQREKRRRKMIVEQQKRYQMIEITRRERTIISTIEQISRQQKQIQYEIWRAWENKNIIVENKNYLAEKIKEKEQIRDINAKFKRDQLLKVYRQEHCDEVGKALGETTLLQRRHQVDNRKKIYNLCEQMVTELLNVTEDMYSSCQERNKPQIHEKELEAALIRFVEGTKTEEDESALRLKHYIEGTHEWGFKVARPEQEVPTDPTEDNALPNQAVNNYYLGNILHSIFQSLYAEPRQAEQRSSGDTILLSMVGLDYSRKHVVAESIKAKYSSFSVIYVDKLIENKIKDFETFKAQGLQISKQTQQLVESCLSGKPIPDDVVIQLIKQGIAKNNHNILVDYPNTYEQAIALCKAIANVEPHDLLPKSKLDKKINEYQRLVKHTEHKLVKRKVRECGIDFVWWIDVTPENSLDRMLGRRWIGNQEVHINSDVEPYQLKQGQKAAALVMNNHFKAKNKNKIKAWFELFGTEFGSEDKISINCWEQIEGNCDKQHLEWTMESKIKEVLSLKEKQKQWAAKAEEQLKKIEEERKQQEKVRQQVKSKCVKANPEELKGQLNSALSKVNLNRQFLVQISELWNRIEHSTVTSLTRAFMGLQGQQLNQRKYIAQVKRNFISLLTREDHKFHLIKDFQTNYNNFFTDNQDMLAYDYTKEQLHQRVEDLQNDLLDVVSEKKEDAITERNGIINSGWLEAQFDIISECLYVLVETELNKYALSEKLIVDYYGKRFMANTKAFQPLSAELNLETINALEIYKEGACLRLEKLISEALRILNRQQQIVDDKNKKGGKGAPPKKDDKKAAKKGGKDEAQENKQPTAEELELKKAINTEKAIFRHRLNKIKTLGALKLRSIFESAHQLYSQLQDLYVYTERVEKKAVQGLAKIFRKAIENEQKIESEVQIHYVEVTQTELIRNFQKQKPVIIPARESVSDRHFTLTNTYEVIKLLRLQAEGHKISTKKLIILLKKIMSHKELTKLLPETWKAIQSSQIQAFVRLIDNENKAYIDLVKIFIFIVMSGYLLPLPDELQQFTLDLTNYNSLKEVTLDKFSSTKAWFDEPIQQKQNVRPFLRNNYVKQILFDIFREGRDSIDISSSIYALSLQEYFKLKQPQPNWTYFDYAFS